MPFTYSNLLHFPDTLIPMEESESLDVLASNVEALMKSRKWKQPELSRESCVSQKAINNLINRKSYPRLDIIQKLANALETEAFILQMPQFNTTLLTQELNTLLINFAHANREGRDAILTAAQQAALLAEYQRDKSEKNNADT